MMMQAIIMKLRRSRYTRPIFGDRVTGVADWTRARDYAAVPYPALFVCPWSDTAETAGKSNDHQQTVQQRWGIILVLKAEDIRAQKPAQDLDSIRRLIFKAIYNWSPNFAADRLDPVEYLTGPMWYGSTELLHVDKDRTFWLLIFGVDYEICGEGDGETEEQFEPLPPFDGINYEIDYKKPHDPGLPPSETYDPRIGPAPWPTGPEGRIELRLRGTYATPSPREDNDDGQTRH